MFICEICKKHPATVHLTDIHNNEKKELHLCQKCAEAKGINFHHNFSLPELLSELTKAHKPETSPDLVCKNCGLSYRDFQARGRFGCAQDYAAFRKELLPMIERIHGRTQHVGHAPSASGGSSKHQELMDLQREMRSAVEREDYEVAAELRDRIGALKQKQAQQQESANEN
jgi:protein arginine kinase activator